MLVSASKQLEENGDHLTFGINFPLIGISIRACLRQLEALGEVYRVAPNEIEEQKNEGRKVRNELQTFLYLNLNQLID